MATYKPSSSTGFASGSSAYDGAGYPGNTSTYASNGVGGATSVTAYVSWNTNLTGMTSVTLSLAYYGESYDWRNDSPSAGAYGDATFVYRWGTGSWTTLDETPSGGTIGAGSIPDTFTLGGFTSSTNLNTLQVGVIVYGGYYVDQIDHNQYDGWSTGNIYDVYVDVYQGYIVNAISGPSTLALGQTAQAGQYSVTVTGDSTNNVTWSVSPSSGSFSGQVDDATSSRVTWTPSTTGTFTLRATSDLDNTKYSTKTVTVGAPVVSAITGSTSIQTGAATAYSATVTNDAGNNITWTVNPSSGSFRGQVDDATSSRVNWTPSAAGNYTLTATSDYDSTAYSTLAVTVTAPSKFKPTSYAAVSGFNAGFTNPGNAYDFPSTWDDTTTYANVTSYTANTTTGRGNDFISFGSLANVSSLQVFYRAQFGATTSGTTKPRIYGYVSWDGGSTWTTFFSRTNLGLLGSTPASSPVYTISPTCNLSQVKVRFAVYSGYTSPTYYSTYIYLYDIYVQVATTYTAVLDHVAPTTTGKIVYASNMFDTSSGTLNTPSTSTAATFLPDGTNGYWFYTGSN